MGHSEVTVKRSPMCKYRIEKFTVLWWHLFHCCRVVVGHL